MNDTIPGILFRLTILLPDGKIYHGPKIYANERTMKQAVKHWEPRCVERQLTMVREGCARGPWLSLDEVA